MAPLSEVLLMALVKVVRQVIGLEVDVPFRIIKLFQDMPVQDWRQELNTVVFTEVSVLNLLRFLLVIINNLVEPG